MDDGLKKAIKETEQTLKLLKILLKLNDAGRERVLIYMFGLTHFAKYRRPEKEVV